MPGAELASAISVLVLGALVATVPRFNPGVGLAVVGLFALFHGYAHGHEMPASATALPFSTGFMLSTALLLGVGTAAGLVFQKQPRVLRWAGASIATSSVCFFMA
jgi:urease accessory protein